MRKEALKENQAQLQENHFQNNENMSIYYYTRIPEDPKAFILLAHGMREKALRYEYTIEKLAANGYGVYAIDHRGHGKTADGDYGYMGTEDSFLKAVKDMKTLRDIMAAQHPGAKIILIGHSMGSFLSLRYAMAYPKDLDGLVLSGTGGFDQIKGSKSGMMLTGWNRRIFGDKHKDVFMDKVFNKILSHKIKNPKTPYDWICTDSQVVQEMVSAPDMGFPFTSASYYYLFRGIAENFNKAQLQNLSKTLPLYIFSGGEDPVGNYGKGVEGLYDYFSHGLGLTDVTLALYEGRHEMLNEPNRDQVIDNLLSWMDERF